jgi:hypothetical protein
MLQTHYFFCGGTEHRRLGDFVCVCVEGDQWAAACARRWWWRHLARGSRLRPGQISAVASRGGPRRGAPAPPSVYGCPESRYQKVQLWKRSGKGLGACLFRSQALSRKQPRALIFHARFIQGPRGPPETPSQSAAFPEDCRDRGTDDHTGPRRRLGTS